MKRNKKPERQKRESGLPGGGAGRRDEVGKSGVYPMSGPHPVGDAPIFSEASWGQGERGAAGYEDSGGSELRFSQSQPEQCRDIMTKDPVCCEAGESVEAAAQLLREHDIGSLPIVQDEDKELVGMLTDRDIALRCVAQGRDPKNTTVEEVMTRHVASCSPDANIHECLEVMEQQKVRRIPVTDRSGRIVGIIAQADIALRLREPQQTAEVVREISMPKAA